MNKDNQEQKKVIALIIGDSYGTGNAAATSLAQRHQRFEVVLVDSSPFYLGQAQRNISKLSQCSTITAELSEPQEVQKVIDLIEDPDIWIQYLVHTNTEFVHDPDDPQKTAENRGRYKITQAAFKNMVQNRSGQIRNINTANQIAYNIIDYKPDTQLPHHTHPKGEILYVLDGVYSDENGHSHQGEYIRNPVDSEHTPFSKEGSLIMVVHKEMNKDDQAIIRANIKEKPWLTQHEVKCINIHEYDKEKVCFVKHQQQSDFQPWLYDNGGEIAYIPNDIDNDYINLYQNNNLPF